MRTECTAGMAQNLFDELPPPQRLALSYAPSAARSATLALLALDARLGAILRRGGEPVLAQMRLAWWRERLVADPASWPGGDAVLGLLRDWREPAALAPLVDGWEALLGDELDARAIGEFARGRGEGFAGLARELGAEASAAAMAGQLWALGDLAANLSDPGERRATLEAAPGLPCSPNLPRALRPLTVLAGLARRSLARGGAPLLDGSGAILVAMRLGITGR
jgi:phytoene synthase